MDNTKQTRLRELTEAIAVETDQEKFTALVKEFNSLLDADRTHSALPVKQ